MKITNVSATDPIQITDLLSDSSGVSQWQEGLRNLLIPANDYRIVPNVLACNSPSVKALLTANKITVLATVEPTGAEPTKEVGGPIIGLVGV